MKKRYFLIGSIVAVAFAAAVMSCNPIEPGWLSCKCSVTYKSMTIEEVWNNEDIYKHGIVNDTNDSQKCKKLANYLVQKEGAKSATCDGYKEN